METSTYKYYYWTACSPFTKTWTQSQAILMTYIIPVFSGQSMTHYAIQLPNIPTETSIFQWGKVLELPLKLKGDGTKILQLLVTQIFESHIVPGSSWEDRCTLSLITEQMFRADLHPKYKFAFLGPTVHLVSTSLSFLTPNFCFKNEMGHFKFIFLTLTFFCFTTNTSPSQFSTLLPATF